MFNEILEKLKAQARLRAQKEEEKIKNEQISEQELPISSIPKEIIKKVGEKALIQAESKPEILQTSTEEIPQIIDTEENSETATKEESQKVGYVEEIQEPLTKSIEEKKISQEVINFEPSEEVLEIEEPEEQKIVEKPDIGELELKTNASTENTIETESIEERQLLQESLETPTELNIQAEEDEGEEIEKSPITETFEENEPINLSDIKIDDITSKESFSLEKELSEISNIKMTIQKEEIPLIRFEGDATAPIIRYDVPSPSAYFTTMYIETDIGKEYFGGENVFKIDPNATEEQKKIQKAELFNVIRKRFLRENHEELKRYFASISREDLEKELEFYALKEEEIGKEILQQARLEAADKALKAARLKADQLKTTANQKQQHATALANQFTAVKNAWVNVQNWYNVIRLTPVYLVTKAAVDAVYNQAKATYNFKKTQLETAQKAAADARASAQEAENEVTRAEERITEIESETASILDLMNLAGMGETLAKYTLFKYLMEIAWTVDDSFPTFQKSMGGKIQIKFAKLRSLEPRLIFVETHKLTNLPGDYGAGTVLKTFSLLPGEQTEISIKTYKKTKEETKEASSILDSYTDEKADEFERGVQSEYARSSQEENSSSFNIGASAGVSIGYANASVSTGYEQGTNSSRSSSAKNAMNATEKHAQKASAMREVTVNTSFEKSAEAGEETSFMRKIENVNVSRTLNFTFRQMNQQFHSILHMINLRIAFYNGYPGSFRLYSLPELKHIVVKYMNLPDKSHDEIFQDIKSKIIQDYTNVLDYQNAQKVFIEEKSNGNGGTYLRVIPPIQVNGTISGKQEYHMREAKADQAPDIRHLDGIIIANRVITMRTDGIIVESLLGKANALDDYSLDTRKERIRFQALTNDKLQSEIMKTDLGLKMIKALVEKGQVELASTLYREIFGVQEGLNLLEDILGTKKELNKITAQ